MRKFALAIWLMLPVLVGAYHYGPGQERLKLDETSALLQQADELVQNEQWKEAVGVYEQALALLPKGHDDVRQRARLERAKAMMLSAELPAANSELLLLVDEMQQKEDSEPDVLNEARAALANSQYYRTWLMRLEGLPRSEWEPEIDAARQTFKMLATTSQSCGDAQNAKRHQEDLESSIKLARMDLNDLQGLPLPSQ
jgi:hypothetical protein